MTLEALLRIGERAADGGGGGKGGGDAGDDLERHAGFGERGHLFGGAAEDERVAALEANDAAIGARVLDHERVDFFLRDGLCAAALAYVDDFGAWGEASSRMACGNEVVVEDDLGGSG
jgi:hypothetical protein